MRDAIRSSAPSPTATGSSGSPRPGWRATSCHRDAASGWPDDAYELGDRGAIVRALARLDHRGRQPRRTRRRGAELPRPRRDPNGSRLRTRWTIDPAAIMGPTTRRRTRASAASRRSSTTAPGCRLHLHQRQEHAALVGRRSQGRGVLLPAGRRHGPAPGVVPRPAPVGRRGGEPRPPAPLPRGLGQRPDPAALGRLHARSPSKGSTSLRASCTLRGAR